MAMKKVNLPLMGGVDLHSDPAAIGEGGWQRLRNLAPRRSGVIGRRPSMSFSRELEPYEAYWDARVAAVATKYFAWAKYLRPLKFIFDPNWGNITMIAVTTGTVPISTVSEVSFTSADIDVPAGTMLLINLPGLMTNGSATLPRLRAAVLGDALRAPSLFVFDGKTYAFNGSSNGLHLDAAVDQSITGSPMGYHDNDFGSGNTNFSPHGGAVIRDRVVYYKGPNVYFSDRGAPLTVAYTGTTDSNGVIQPSTSVPPTGTNYSAEATRGILVGADAPEDITAVAEISTSADGSPIQSVAGVWTKTSCYLLLGEPLETTLGGDIRDTLQVNKLNVAAGCVSQSTITRTPYGMFWVGIDDVWFMPTGSLPLRVGTKIRPYIEGQPQSLLWRLHAEYADGMFRVAMFKEGQGPTAYDPCPVQWWLNLKNGPPQSAADAQWFGPQEFVQSDCPDSNGAWGTVGQGGTWCMAKDARDEEDGRLYALQPYIITDSYFGNTVESVYGMSLCGFDTYDPADTTAPQRTRGAEFTAVNSYSEGDEIVPQAYGTGGLGGDLVAPVYKCTTAGISDVSEPNWFIPASDGTVGSGTSIWHCKFFTDTDGGQAMSGYDRAINQEGRTMGNNSNKIQWSALSRELILDDHTKEKLLDGVEMVATLGGATKLTYNTHPDQGEYSKVWVPDFTIATTLNTTELNRAWQRKMLTPDPTKRFHALSAVWECEQQAGIYIQSGVNDTWAMSIGAASFTVTVTAGWYENLYALAQELRTAYALVSGGSTITTSLDASGYVNKATFQIYCSVDNLVLVTTGKLAQIFGFVPSQSPITIANHVTDAARSYESPECRTVADMILSTINLRWKAFKRDPE